MNIIWFAGASLVFELAWDGDGSVRSQDWRAAWTMVAAEKKLVFICSCRIETGVSIKRPGWDEPAQHQMMLGGTSSFHVVASASTWEAEDGLVKSADM